VNVDVLQMHLTNLSQLLRSAGGQKTATELDDLCQLLQPYRDQKLKDLIASIARADEIIRNGLPAPKARKASSKVVVDAGPITAKIVDLYQRAGQPSVSRDEILAAFAEVEGLNLSMDQLKAIAKQVGVSEKATKKADLHHRIRQAALDRKGAADRVLA
jgi:hypothetical protein